MHSESQISLHAIAPPFNSSRDAKIQRLCRAKLRRGSAPTKLSSTQLCTDQFIRLHVLDKISASSREELAITLDKSKVKYAFFRATQVCRRTRGNKTEVSFYRRRLANQ
jgi:hypothetical protein